MNFKISILNLKINNLKSLYFFFNQFGKVEFVDNHTNNISETDILIIPGNGNFKAGMDTIKKNNLTETIFEFNQKNKKIIGICLGMQLLFNDSDENKNVGGLKLINGTVKKINSEIYKLPLLGWYELQKNANPILSNKTFFFNNNYSVFSIDKTLEISHISNQNKNNICAIVKKNNIFGLQFHPEKSSHNGKKVIEMILNNEL
ncbi:imidazole glycerol phosphate synthase subunit HisH [Candidatus Pelagibacter sp.]|uniref:imidazole glycerol phosphate synthase subunit HisH n=1 Tax=Candidatus Pelagibacter sp. TaxID=2024849 RepID=UPI003F852A52